MQATLDIPYAEARNRGTVLVRIILAIPHLLLAGVLASVAQMATLVHWFIQLFTGKRNPGLTEFVGKVLAYQTRVMTYAGLMYDEYPGFFDDQGRTPVQVSVPSEEGPVNRLTVGLRFIWVIPAAIIGALLSIAIEVVVIVCWFAVVITGKMPQGMYDFMLKGHRFMVQLNAYSLLLTDTYPKYG